MNGMNHTFPAEAGPHLPIPEEWKAELAIDTTAVSKQSTQDRYVTDITVVSCMFIPSRLTGGWKYDHVPAFPVYVPSVTILYLRLASAILNSEYLA